jgi:hypothetical protein
MVVTVTGGPFGVIVADTSGGTLYSVAVRVFELPTVVRTETTV